MECLKCLKCHALQFPKHIQWSPENADSLHIFFPLCPLWSHWGVLLSLLSPHTIIISPLSTCAGVAPLAAWCWLSSQHCTGRLYSATHRGLSSWRLSAALGCHNVCLVLISRWRIDSLRKSQTCFIVQPTQHRERYPLNAEFSIKVHFKNE